MVVLGPREGCHVVVRQEVADRLAASHLDPATRTELLTRLQNVRE